MPLLVRSRAAELVPWPYPRIESTIAITSMNGSVSQSTENSRNPIGSPSSTTIRKRRSRICARRTELEDRSENDRRKSRSVATAARKEFFREAITAIHSGCSTGFAPIRVRFNVADRFVLVWRQGRLWRVVPAATIKHGWRCGADEPPIPLSIRLRRVPSHGAGPMRQPAIGAGPMRRK